MRRLSEVMGEAVERVEVLRLARAQAVLRRWSEAVDPPMSERCRPDRYDRGTLWIATDSATWAQELRFHRDRILRTLNSLAGERALFTDLRVAIRKPIKDYGRPASNP